MTDEDHLSNEVSIEGQITETGLSARAKSRAIAAIDRLVGAAVDVPAAKMEAWASRLRNQGRLDSATYDAAVERVRGRIGGDGDTGRLVDEVVASRIEAIANKKHVAKRAIEYLASPRTDEQAEAEPASAELDPDWLNYFGGYAEKASSENVRELWGRVLAGEIRRPGSFSRATLRLLAELDQQTASWFEQETELRFDGNSIVRPDNPGNEQVERLNVLEQMGFIQHTHPRSGMGQDFEPDSKGYSVAVEGDLGLRMKIDATVTLEVIPLTRIGQEIAKILPPIDPMAVLRRLGEALAGKVTSMDICRVVSRDGNDIRLSAPIVVLKPAPKESR